MAAIPLLIAAAALAVAAYIGLGGRAIFGHREHPEKLSGATIVLSGFDSTHLTDHPKVSGRVVGFDGSAYVLDTELGQLRCSARHRGYAVSLITNRCSRRVVVNVCDEAGQGDIALASLPSVKVTQKPA